MKWIGDKTSAIHLIYFCNNLYLKWIFQKDSANDWEYMRDKQKVVKYFFKTN